RRSGTGTSDGSIWPIACFMASVSTVPTIECGGAGAGAAKCVTQWPTAATVSGGVQRQRWIRGDASGNETAERDTGVVAPESKGVVQYDIDTPLGRVGPGRQSHGTFRISYIHVPGGYESLGGRDEHAQRSLDRTSGAQGVASERLHGTHIRVP